MSNKDMTEYDKNGNLIYQRNSDGDEFWYEYDEKGNLIYYKLPSWDLEYWREYDKLGNYIYITKQEFENIKIKEYNSRTKCSRFELIEI